MRKILLYTGCTYAGCDNYMIVEVEDSVTDEELEIRARDFMEDALAPECSWKEASEEDIEDHE